MLEKNSPVKSSIILVDTLKPLLGLCMAEREGFEPSIGVKAYTPLAGERLQPLGHFSVIFNYTFCNTDLFYMRQALPCRVSRYSGLLPFALRVSAITDMLNCSRQFSIPDSCPPPNWAITNNVMFKITPGDFVSRKYAAISPLFSSYWSIQ